MAAPNQARCSTIEAADIHSFFLGSNFSTVFKIWFGGFHPPSANTQPSNETNSCPLLSSSMLGIASQESPMTSNRSPLDANSTKIEINTCSFILPTIYFKNKIKLSVRKPKKMYLVTIHKEQINK